MSVIIPDSILERPSYAIRAENEFIPPDYEVVSKPFNWGLLGVTTGLVVLGVAYVAIKVVKPF